MITTFRSPTFFSPQFVRSPQPQPFFGTRGGSAIIPAESPTAPRVTTQENLKPEVAEVIAQFISREPGSSYSEIQTSLQSSDRQRDIRERATNKLLRGALSLSLKQKLTKIVKLKPEDFQVSIQDIQKISRRMLMLDLLEKHEFDLKRRRACEQEQQRRRPCEQEQRFWQSCIIKDE